MEEGDYDTDRGDEVEEGERENESREEEDWEDESELEDKPESNGEGSDEEGDLTDDALGPDDGEVDEDHIAVLGFAAF